MTKDEALKLALEALEKMDKVMKRSPDTDKAIIAIKEALAQPQPQRKPLTSKEIRAIEVEVAMSNSFAHPTKAEEFVRAIEAKLMERNT